MKYIVDHDYHIHSKISSCSNDPEQTTERILQYAEENNLKQVCITDHFWDENVPGASNWYKPQDFTHISQAKPLPQSDNVNFLFGCETELDKFLNLGVSQERIKDFDFVIIPTTHFHMTGFTVSEEQCETLENRAKAWVTRFNAVLDMPLPFKKIGIAHLTCGLIARSSRMDYLKTLELIPSEEMERLFKKAAAVGVGIELNSGDMKCSDEETDIVLRPYKIAKQCGCKFYCGSDAHHPAVLDAAKAIFERAVNLLDLKESDKFIIDKHID